MMTVFALAIDWPDWLMVLRIHKLVLSAETIGMINTTQFKFLIVRFISLSDI
jgi:hypothetical protein